MLLQEFCVCLVELIIAQQGQNDANGGANSGQRPCNPLTFLRKCLLWKGWCCHGGSWSASKNKSHYPKILVWIRLLCFSEFHIRILVLSPLKLALISSLILKSDAGFGSIKLRIFFKLYDQPSEVKMGETAAVIITNLVDLWVDHESYIKKK